MRQIRRPLIAALLVTGLTAVTACTAATSEGTSENGLKTGAGVTKDSITVMSLTDLSGPGASGGKPTQAGMEAYFDHLNEEGGVDGRKIELKTVDTQYNPQLAVQGFQANKNDIAALITYGTPTTDAIRPFTSTDNVLALGFKGPYAEENTFTSGSAFEVDTANLLSWELEQNPDSKIGMIYQADALGDAIKRGVESWSEATGGEIVAEASADGTATDLTAQVTAMRRAGADTLLLGMGPGASIAAIGAASSLGYDAKLLSPGTTFNAALLDLPVGPTMEKNMIVTCSYPLWDDDVPGNKTFHDALPADTAPQGTIVLGWVIAQTMAGILTQASEDGDLTPAGIVAAATRTTVETDGLTPDIKFGKDISERLPFRESKICSVGKDEDDGLTMIEDWSESEAATNVALQ